MREHYDIAFLGGGPAGYQGAIRAAQLGARVHPTLSEGILEMAQALHGQAIHVPPEARAP